MNIALVKQYYLTFNFSTYIFFTIVSLVKIMERSPSILDRVQTKLLKNKPLLQRYDILIFLFIYPWIIYPAYNRISECWIYETIDDPSNSSFNFIFDHVDPIKLQPHIFVVLFPIIVVLVNIVVLCLPYWSFDVMIKLHYQPATENTATCVAFIPEIHQGLPQIVPIVSKGSNRNLRYSYAMFQGIKYELIGGSFVQIRYPISEKIKTYKDCKGLTEEEASKKIDYYGYNDFKMPIPPFWTLFAEQILSPFFAFQIFSVFVLMLDQYWTTPLFSLVTLLIMQYSNVKTRQSNMLDLRGAEPSPFVIYVKRSGKWRKIQSVDIVPGDIIVIDRPVTSTADLLVIDGRCVVNEANLTGESVPQLKDPVDTIGDDVVLNVDRHRRHVVFSGTFIEQIIPSEIDSLPSKGMLCYVLSTGTGSTHGKLIRTILSATMSSNSYNRDTFYLLMFLCVFAVIAAGYFVIYGSQSINYFRLLVQALVIITTSVPPDLPMQMSFQINATLLALSKLSVFCTEPFRITYAGMVSVCCFDKTGTLTSEDYRLVGVNYPGAPESRKRRDVVGEYYQDSNDLPLESLMVLGGCHSLVRGEKGKFIGDSLEEAAFTAMRFELTSDNTYKHKRCTIKPVREYHFSSHLRMMSVVATVANEKGYIILSKGAPEKINEVCKDGVPSNYQDYTRQGCRVIALAYKRIDEYDRNMSRESIEKDLIFAGFAIFSAPLKRGSEDSIWRLLNGTHRVVIITGDAPLTACHVAKRLRIIPNSPAIHLVIDDQYVVQNEYGKSLDSDENYSPCYTGDALKKLSDEEYIRVVKTCNIFARMSPDDKAAIIAKLNELGYYTLMCGDGTNDVGALRQAHIGVGLLENALQDEVIDAYDDQFKPKLGAASIASPFVSKRPTISSCVDIIRFGRSTLSSTLDLFKQISVNCMITAYTMSVLMIENVRKADIQLTAFGVVLSIAGMSTSWAKPRRKLSTERPFLSQFNLYLVSSVMWQFFVHFVFLQLTHRLVVKAGHKIDKFNPRAHFSPNLLNTAFFLIGSEMEIGSYVCNYRGSPFMQSFTENKSLLVGTVLSYGLIFFLLLDISPWVRTHLKLVEFPTHKFQFTLMAYCALDFALSLLGEWACLYIFSRQNKEIASGLVEPKVLENIKDYTTYDDDLLPNELHEFGFMEFVKQNMLMRNTANKKEMKMLIRENEKKKKRQELEDEVRKNK